MPMCRCGLVLSKAYQAFSPSYAENAAFIGQSPGWDCNRSSSYWLDTVVPRQCNSCLLLDRPLAWFFLSGSLIISLRFCAIFIGCVHCRESNTVWRRWRSVVNIKWLLYTCHWSYGVRLALFPEDNCVRLIVPRTKRSTNRRSCVSSCGHARVKQSVAGCYSVIVSCLI